MQGPHLPHRQQILAGTGGRATTHRRMHPERQQWIGKGRGETMDQLQHALLAQATHIRTYGAGFGDLVDGGAHHNDYSYFITHTPQTKYYT